MKPNKNFKKNQLEVVKLRDDNNNILCELLPLNKLNPLSDELINLFVKWRNKSMKYFKTQFHAEAETTKRWLQSNIRQNNRILFLVFVNGKPVGHYGLCNINETSAELDNAIRGERGGVSDLFIKIEKYLIQYCFQKLDVKIVTAKVFSNNFLALAMHQKLGFVICETYPLQMLEYDGKRVFIECESEVSNVPFNYVELKLPNTNYLC